MVQPINYMSQIPQPDLGQSLLSGLQLGTSIREIQEKRVASEQAEQMKAAYKTDLQEVLNNPSMKAFNDFSLKYPQQREVIKDVASRFTTEQQDAEFNIGRDVAVALENNKPEIALGILTQTVDARKKSNLPPSVYGQIQQILSNVDDPDRVKKAKAQTNFALTLLNPEKFGKVVDSLEKQKLAPSVLSKAVADAGEAVSAAEIKAAEAKDTPARLLAEKDLREAQAKQEVVKAKFAERTEVDNVIKRALDAGLTKAQTNQVLIENKTLNLAGKLALLDYNAAVRGVPLPSKNTGTTVGNASEDERKAAGWLVQADNAYKNILGAMYTKEGKPTGAEEKGFFEALPFIGGGGATQSEKRQQFVQAASSLSEALLRAATGAGQNENEAKQKIEELTPQYFDTRGTIDQKLKAIPVYLNSLKERAGRAAPKDYQIPTVPGVFVTSSDGKQLRFDNQGQADAFKQAEAAEIARLAKTSTTKAVGNK
jgi:hypothetical protein